MPVKLFKVPALQSLNQPLFSMLPAKSLLDQSRNTRTNPCLHSRASRMQERWVMEFLMIQQPFKHSSTLLVLPILFFSLTVPVSPSLCHRIWPHTNSHIDVVTQTIKVPKNIRIVGEIWALIMAGGSSTWKDQNNPKPVLQVGEVGDSGSVEISDIIIETM